MEQASRLFIGDPSQAGRSRYHRIPPILIVHLVSYHLDEITRIVHPADLTPWQHSHRFHTANTQGEKNTHRVVALTTVMMVVEITCGWMFNSMALLADGWHMSSHVLALGVFASAILLGVVALFMIVESGSRWLNPVPIRFDQAIVDAVPVAPPPGKCIHT